MNRMIQVLQLMGTLAVLVLSLGAQVRQDQVERGGEWLSWTPAERNTFVYGFIDGYMGGTLDACYIADDLFEVGKPHRLGDERHPTEVPSGRCLDHVDRDYSRINFTKSRTDASPYVDVITEFYTKHPEYGGVDFVHLLRLLNDKNHKTADQLYGMAIKGKLRPVR